MIIALEDAKYKLIGMREPVEDLGSALRIDEITEKIEVLEKETYAENFWADSDNSARVLK